MDNEKEIIRLDSVNIYDKENINDRFLEMNYLIHHINNSFAVLYSAVCIASGEEDET